MSTKQGQQRSQKHRIWLALRRHRPKSTKSMSISEQQQILAAIFKSAQEPQVSRKELYEMIRKQIEHEDNLVNQRLNWLLIAQAFLFAAITAILTHDKPIGYVNGNYIPWVPFGITIMGFFINLFSFIGIRAAYKSLKRLRENWYYPCSCEEERGNLIKDGFPQITWVGQWYEKSFNTSSGIPILIMITWTLLAYAVIPIRDIEITLPLFAFAIISIIIMLITTFKN